MLIVGKSLIDTIFFQTICNKHLLLRGDYRNLFVRKKFNFFHEYHILDYSPWPFLASLSVFLVAAGLVVLFHYFYLFHLSLGFVQLALVVYLWFDDIVGEGVDHTDKIRTGLRVGMFLFILSEVMFFFSFFWAYFHASLSPAVELGCSWPPVGLLDVVIAPLQIPFLNTLILLYSGVTITCAHHAFDFSSLDFKKKIYKLYLLIVVYSLNLKQLFRAYVILSSTALCITVFYENKGRTRFYLIFTVLLAMFFTALQMFEYYESAFFMSDGVYGSTFFLMTGFHGFHVIIGTIMIMVCLGRFIKGHFDDSNCVGLECAIWYWHFVDVVWLFLFFCIYIWGFVVRTGGFIVVRDFRLFEEPQCCILDFAHNFQYSFQDPATIIMSDLLKLHNSLMILLIILLVFVSWLFISTSISSHRKYILYFYNICSVFGSIRSREGVSKFTAGLDNFFSSKLFYLRRGNLYTE